MRDRRVGEHAADRGEVEEGEGVAVEVFLAT
jgi:hypothetical protein